MFICLLLVLGSYSHAFTLKFNLTNATILTAWNRNAPNVVAIVTVADKSNVWPEINNTFTPIWMMAYTWTDLTDANLASVAIRFVDDRIGEVINSYNLNLSDRSYKSQENNPVIHHLNFNFSSYVTFNADVTITDSDVSNTSCSTISTQSECRDNPKCYWYSNTCNDETYLCERYTCDTCLTAELCANAAVVCVWNSTSGICVERRSENECSSYTMEACLDQNSCAWYQGICYPSTWLCSGVTCDSCSNSVSCTSDPDIISAGGCSWDSSSNACYNITSCVKVCAEASAGCKPSCIMDIEGCPCVCDTSGCVYKPSVFVGEGKKWNRSIAFEDALQTPPEIN